MDDTQQVVKSSNNVGDDGVDAQKSSDEVVSEEIIDSVADNSGVSSDQQGDVRVAPDDQGEAEKVNEANNDGDDVVVGSAQKEVEPFPRASSEQHMMPTESKVELSDELKEAGVEHPEDHEKPELSAELKEAGVEHAKDNVELDVVSVPVVQLPPYTREEVLPHAQNGPVSDAARWFYTFLLRQIDKVKKQDLK